MRRLRSVSVLVAMVLLTIGLLIWLTGRAPEESTAQAAVQREPDVVTPPLAIEPQPAEAGVELHTEPVAREEVPQPLPTTQAMSDSQKCVVFGRAVDELDQPLVGVQVRLSAYKVWAEGHDVPRLPGKYDIRGWELVTDAQGEFRFEVPTPTADATSLSIEPDAFHDAAQVILGSNRSEARPKLLTGENDLGVFRLVTTGAIRGHVNDEAGQPLRDAQLNLGTERSSTLGHNTASDANGAYTIAHVAAGSYGVNVKCEGYLSEFRKPIDVATNRFTDGADFVLRRAPTLRGIVVDDAGTPLGDVRLWGWPSTSGQGAGATSAADGSFTIFLPQDEPYTLEATLKGFEPYHVHDRSVHYPPGTNDLHVELKRAATWPMLVIDASTEKPIERFGFNVLLNTSDHAKNSVYTSGSPPRPANHAGGLVDVDMRPGVDTILVAAPDYEEQTVDLEAGDPPERRIVVRMTRGAVLVGRLLMASVPVPAITVRLERGSFDYEFELGDNAKNQSVFRPERDDVRNAKTDKGRSLSFRGSGTQCIQDYGHSWRWSGDQHRTVRDPSAREGPRRSDLQRGRDDRRHRPSAAWALAYWLDYPSRRLAR